ncbi:MAG: PD-(D/E)XK nuclease family protein [Bacillota bacterium]|nr:PD-(D/E)XK nuclease family protein [Bacillota bacterium]
MLHFILGKSGTGKTTLIHQKISELVKIENKEIILLVPEQNSFETEKEILRLLAPADCRNVNVLTFSRLVEFVFRQTGGLAGRKVDDGGRSVFMSLAIEAAKDQLELYKYQIDKPDFIDLMITTVNEYKKCCISTDIIREKARIINDAKLKQKLVETSLVADIYDTLLHNSYVDPMDELTMLYEKLSQIDFFGGYTVFVDSFSGFTMQEQNILENIISKSYDSFFAFTTADERNTDVNNPDFTVNRTIKRLKMLAKRNGVLVAVATYLEDQKRIHTRGLQTLLNGAFNPLAESYKGEVIDIELYCGEDIYDETNYIATTIKRLVIEENYSYNDFVVVCRNSENYLGVLDSVLEKFDIPYFMDKPEPLDGKPLMKLVLSAFDVVHYGFRSEDIFKILKSDLTNFTTEEIASLENYIFIWNINGSAWLSEFYNNPRGFANEEKQSDIAELESLNKLRKRIILPLITFKNKIQNCDGLSISKAVYELLTALKVPEKLENNALKLKDSSEFNTANEQLRLWDYLIDILDQSTEILDNTQISSKRYAALLKLQIRSGNISFIPQSMDQVIIGTADRIRLSSPKIVFMIGAIEGEFPHIPVPSGIFSDNERKMLLSLDLPVYDSVLELASFEKYLASTVMTAPKEKLYVSWYAQSLSGEQKSPSQIVREIKRLLPDILVKDRYIYTPEDSIWGTKQAFEACAKIYKSKSKLSENLKYYFSKIEDYKDKFAVLDIAANEKPFMISDKEKAKDLFHENMTISASQIEKFYLCRFQYFCRYGLRLKERKPSELDALEYGSLVHYLFENILKQHEISALKSMSSEELKFEIKKLLEIYISEYMGGVTGKSTRFIHIFYKISDAALMVLQHMIIELSQSEFRPSDFELSIGDEIPPYILQLPTGEKVSITGKIDRVDIMKHEDTSYVRVIDYKTGKKEFKLSDVLYGLNLQMLIYLSALSKNGNKKFGSNIMPAGILYMPSSVSSISAKKGDSKEQIERANFESYKMSGLILDQKEVIEGMEKDVGGVFIPVKKGKDGYSGSDSLAGLEEMGILFKKIDNLAIEMAKSLHSGDIDAVPAKGGYDACAWCPYCYICGFQEEKQSNDVKKFSKDQVIELLQSENENNN